MRLKETPPVYSKVALDIAAKIARGDIKEGQKLSGRSLTASDYEVSSETIRRAFRLLSDMGILEVKANSGSTVISRKNAVSYIKKFKLRNDIRMLNTELQHLVFERDALNDKILEISNQIITIHTQLSTIEPLQSFEFKIPENSPLLGVTVADSKFWQHTGGTIVAIKRQDHIIISPGPYAIFMNNDIIVVYGEIGIFARVMAMISPPDE